MPTDTDALPRFPERDVRTDGVDASGNLVAGHTRIFDAGPVTFFDQSIAVTDSAGFYLDADLASSGIGDGAIDDFEISTWLADLNRFHEDLLSEGSYIRKRRCKQRLYEKSLRSSLSQCGFIDRLARCGVAKNCRRGWWACKNHGVSQFQSERTAQL
jgi:hypothetical protein